MTRVVKSLAITRPGDLPDEIGDETLVACLPASPIHHVPDVAILGRSIRWAALCGAGEGCGEPSRARSLAAFGHQFRLCKACVAELGDGRERDSAAS